MNFGALSVVFLTVLTVSLPLASATRSCIQHGITVCCTLDNCPQQISPDGCYCDDHCSEHGDCCDDINQVCPRETCDDEDIRLVGGSNDLEGRVEVCLNNEWGTICHHNWTNDDARVVCGELGHPNTGAAALRNARFTSGSGPIHFTQVTCTGNESSLFDCPYDNRTSHCNHGMDASVICGNSVCTDGDVRLVNGGHETQGRVEVCLDGIWGSVCDKGWGRLDATVVCRQLNLSADRVVAVGRSYFGSATEAINMNDVQCNGTEGRLIDCKYNENSDCSHANDASVFCGIRLGCLDGSVRLANGTNSSEGRVEICKGSSWVTVCDDGWDSYAASVICRQLGYPSAGAIAFNGSQYGPGNSQYMVEYTNVTCTGHETTLRGCVLRSTNSSVCPHTRDAGVRCLKGPGECTDGSVRLVDGIDDYEGRVEVCLFERWGTVCDHSWSTAHAEVICRQLGLPTFGAIAYSGAYHGIGMGPINIDNAVCTGDEFNITQCSFTSNDNCQHTNDASVKCACVSGEVRLVGGRNELEGRVEICFNGVWGTVSDDAFDSRESDVICRQLGYYGNVTFPKLFAFYGQGSGPIHFTSLSCNGDEERLIDCRLSTDTSRESHAEDAGVICNNGSRIGDDVCTDGDVKLYDVFGAEAQKSGQVIICAGGMWTTVCFLGWDGSDSAAICSNLGFPKIGSSNYRTFSFVRAPVSLSIPACQVREESIFDCVYSEFDFFLCTGNPLFKVFTTCYDSDGCEHGSVRLSHGSVPNEGLVEVCYEGVWSTVTSTSWNQFDAKVVCSQLGYFPYLAISRNNGYYSQGSDSQPVALHALRCTGNENNLTECSGFPVPLGQRHSADAGVQCFTGYGDSTAPNCTLGSLRLVGGATSLEGRVEVCLNGVWGTVCDDFFTANSANVICRQLGFTGYGAVALPLAHYGQGNGSIFLDNLFCTGHENNWWECPGYSGIHNCRHSEDVSVRCKARECTDGDVRLADGSTDLEGRVEVCVNGTWGTVCDDFWTGVDAKVVCRQLGYSGEFALGYNSGHFGPGTHLPIVADNFHCIGNESSLLDCPFETHVVDCTHNEDAGIKCYDIEGSGTNTSVCSTYDIRLVNGTSNNTGRVEVCIDNVWGTVCDDRFDPIDARIACKQLGFSEVGASAIAGSPYGPGQGPIFMDNTYCFGTEDALLECLFDAHTTDCSHSRDVGLVCSVKNECTAGDIRLINGSRPTEGRLEICYEGVWGTVTSIGFDHNDARVACGQLGYDRNYAITYGFNTAGYFGEGTGPVHIHNIACNGDEPSLLNCTFGTLSQFIINPHVADAGVRCFNTTDPPCIPGALRLADGNSSNEGRLEMCFDGVWGTLCGILWIEIDTLVACRQLGYNDYTALTLPAGSYGLGNVTNSTVPIYLTPLCNGREDRLLDCAHYQVGICNHTHDTAVRCFNTDSCPEGSLRLINPRTSSEIEGRVEICQHGVWGTICDDFLSHIDARVACRSLGMGDRFAVSYVGGYFGSGNGPIHIDDLACTGTEKNIINCQYDSFTDDCTHDNDAGIACFNESQCVSGSVRLVGGNATYEGRLDFCTNGIWGSVCGNDFGLTDAQVVCRQLGYNITYAAPYYSAYYGRGYSEIVADHVGCFGQEAGLGNCRYDVNVGNCNHGNDVGVACYPEAQCDSDGEVRLVDGSTSREGRVEVCLNGVWGTVEDDGFDTSDASVVCRTLGYPTIGAEVFSRSYFGPGNGPVHMNFLGCNGQENNLTECYYFSVLTSSQHNEDVGVRCYSLGQCTNGAVRLAGGANDMEGRVEICINGTWGTVSMSSWTSTNSRVVCGQLGYSKELAFFASFGAGQGPIYYNLVSCDGNEESIFNCSYSTVTFFLSHSRDAGVKCFNQSSGSCLNGAIRLVNPASSSSSSSEGRVEMCAQGVWQMVCHNGWGQPDANVVCRELGYGEYGSVPKYASFYGHSSAGFLMGGVDCNGGEDKLVDCFATSNPNCNILNSAGVSCVQRSCTDGDVRLVGSSTSELEGRVEVCIGGVWGTVCHNGWSTVDARIVCRQLGQVDITAVAVSNAYYGLGTGPILMTNVRCVGNESKLVNCTYSTSVGACSHGIDAGVRCYENVTGANCTLGGVRLMGGATAAEGRVEVCIDGDWGTVCDSNWNTLTARVVCRQLNYQGYIATPYSSSYFPPAPLSLPVHINYVFCSGTESNLLHCGYRDNTIGCDHIRNDVGVRCYRTDNCTHGSLRLNSLISFNFTADGRIGRLEMCYNGVWSTISSSFWTTSYYPLIACRQLGLEAQGAVPTTVRGVDFGPNTRPRLVMACGGSEAQLVNCYHTPSNAQGSVAAIYCPPTPCTDGQVRLVNGTVPSKGRVELCIDNTWGTVADDFWSYFDGRVVCRQLGYSSLVLTVRYDAYYGPGRGPIHITNTRCLATEDNLLECRHSRSTQAKLHVEDAGVDCNPTGQCTHGEIRLVGGSVAWEGRLEACIDGVWGTVTDDRWTFYESRVVCGQLGYSRRYALHVNSSVFGQNTNLPIVMDNVFCGTSDELLVNCSFSYYISYFDTHAKDVGILCYPEEAGNCTTGDARLINGDTPYEGTVQICIGGEWGTVCDNAWDTADAQVVCRQLGYSEAGITAYRSSFFSNTTTGPIYLNYMYCSGSEANLLQCLHSPYTRSCSHDTNTGVVCHPGNNCTSGDVRLAGSSLSYEGRVEVCVDGVWGTVCHDFWNQNDSTVVCRQLGLPYQFTVPFREGYFGTTNHPIVLNRLQCTGTESNLTACSSTTIIGTCTHEHDVGVACLAQSMCNHGDLRFLNGTNGTNYGTLEICLNGVWGTICDQYWDSNDATVACTALGLTSTYAKPFHSGYYGSGKGPIFLSQLNCKGSESNLTDCIHSQEINCLHTNDAGVQCLTQAECSNNGQMRLVNGSTSAEGRLEVCVHGVWGTVSDDLWDTITGGTICKILGFSEQVIVRTGGYYGRGVGPVHLDDVYCFGDEESILDCRYVLNDGSKTHAEDVGVKCLIAGDCVGGDVRLVGSDDTSEGRVEICVNGLWGTVNDYGWSSQAALVVCRQLGYNGNYALGYLNSYHGPGNGTVALGYTSCTGTESNLLQCPHTKFPFAFHHFDDAGVKCYNNTDTSVCSTGDVRLVGGATNNTGVAEVCIDGQWGTLCGNYLLDSTADVICGQLGFASRGSIVIHGTNANLTNSNSTDPIWLSSILCQTGVNNILECSSDPDTRSCTRRSDIGVVCTQGECISGQVRLVNGSNPMEGRVELCEGSKWGTVCDDYWDHRDAQVICKQLGYSGDYASPHHFNAFPGANVPIIIDSFHCQGNESQWTDCEYSTAYTFVCSHTEDAGVRCFNDTISPNCSNGDVRLVDGAGAYEGRVEVCIFGEWSTVCDDDWDDRDVSVICNQLGYNDTGVAISLRNSYYGGGTGPVSLAAIQCSGEESDLLKCPHTASSKDCDHTTDAGARCIPGNECNVTGALRLVSNNSSTMEGRVEVCSNGFWMTLPNTPWSSRNSRVVCKQLGYSPYFATEITPPSGKGPIYLSSFSCEYNQNSLFDCPQVDTFYFYNDHYYDVGVRCYNNNAINCNPGAIRLTNGTLSTNGRPELCWNGINWIPLDTLTQVEARVICAHLGYDGLSAISKEEGTYGQSTANASVVTSYCSGSESSYYACNYYMQSGSLLNTPAIECSQAAGTCTDGDVRLTDGATEFEGRVEICYGNSWGTINDELALNLEAFVICHQLGHSDEGSVIFTNGRYGSSDGLPIAYTLAICRGQETHMSNCSLSYFEFEPSENSIGVKCQPKYVNTTSSSVVPMITSTTAVTPLSTTPIMATPSSTLKTSSVIRTVSSLVVLQPSNVRVNSLRATIGGTRNDFNDRVFQQTIATVINSYCSNSQCRKKRSDDDDVSADDVVIISVTDGDNTISVEFYVKGNDDSPIDVDALQNAVQAGIDDGTFTDAGFNVMSIERTTPLITSTPGVTDKSTGGLSSAASVGLALGIIIIIVVISSIIILITLIWLKRRTTTYQEKDILLDDTTGYLSNRSSCVDLEVPNLPPVTTPTTGEEQKMSEKELEKFDEAMRETSEVNNENVETTDQV